MTVKPWLLVAALTGSSGLAGGGGGSGTVAATRTKNAYVVFREAGSVKHGTQKLQIAVYDKMGGRLRWRRQVPGRLGGAGNGTRKFPGWGVAGSVLWVARNTDGVTWTTDNLGFRLSDGQPLWENIDVGYPLSVSRGQMLFQRLNSQLARPDLRQVELVINNLSTGAEKRLNLQLPARPGCGDINDYSYGDADHLKTWPDARFFYARHKDACGVFVTRFDWHGPATQKSLVTAK